MIEGFRNRWVPVYWDFNTMKIEGGNRDLISQLFGFKGISVYHGSSFEGFHCTFITFNSSVKSSYKSLKKYEITDWQHYIALNV